jgi:hypothetical protein
MSEIKSTLDLVMERTKHLTLNETEKEGQKKADLKKRLNGLIQKYQDQMIKPTELFSHLNELTTTFGRGVEKQMANEILSRIDVEADDDRLLALLGDHFGLEISTLRMIQSEFRQAIQTGKIKRIDILKSELSDNHGISGTAVIPNIEIDPEWQQERNAIIKRLQIQMEAERNRLTSQ